MEKIKVDFSKIKGTVRPMHAVNNCPSLPGDSMFHYYEDAGIPYSRLHDTGTVNTKYVDIDYVFPNFDADPNDPASYDFAFTDVLFKNLTKHKIKPYYRLGCTIENYHYIKAYHCFPPKDNLKWARICEGIIRHYNEGWADGFHYGIEYWEIWNEPDNEPDPKDHALWKGTKEQYYELYATAASYLKEKFPYIKIGGYGSCGFYSLLGEKGGWWTQDAKCSARAEYFIEFFEGFLQYITDDAHPAPLDFFSFHSYAPPKDSAVFAKFARETLDKYGFTDTQTHFNEWNGRKERGSLNDASTIAEMMLTMHNIGVDMCMYYDGKLGSGYNGIINPITQKPFKAYYVFKAFNELYKLKNEASCTYPSEKLIAMAASDEDNGAVMIVNKENESVEINVELDSEVKGRYHKYRALILDEEHNLEEVVKFGGDMSRAFVELTLPAYATCLVIKESADI